MIGHRLRVARRATGLSLRDISARIDNRVTAQAISKYEQDETMPSSGVLIALAAVLNVSVDYLVGDQEMALEAIEFRRKKLTGSREVARIEATVMHLMERYLTVEEFLGLPSIAWDKPRAAPWPVLHDVAETEHAAQGLRDHWGLGAVPISNLVRLSEDRGIKVVSTELRSVDGLTANVRRGDGSAASVIVVNNEHWGERQRFTIAHELGHMVLDVDSKVDNEAAAHRFAGAFLMPADTLRAEIGRCRSSVSWGELIELKRIFGVSLQAIAHRCKELGILSNALFRSLFAEFKRQGWRSPPYREPLAMVGEKPRRFERLCFRAVVEGAISEAKAAELLGHSVHELNRRLNAPPDMEAAAEA